MWVLARPHSGQMVLVGESVAVDGVTVEELSSGPAGDVVKLTLP